MVAKLFICERKVSNFIYYFIFFKPDVIVWLQTVLLIIYSLIISFAVLLTFSYLKEKWAVIHA